MSYKQLIEGQRYKIQAYPSQHLSYRKIGRRLNASHKWIYGNVQRDKRQGGKLYKHLRHSGIRYRKGSRVKRVIIPNRMFISLFFHEGLWFHLNDYVSKRPRCGSRLAQEALWPTLGIRSKKQPD